MPKKRSHRLEPIPEPSSKQVENVSSEKIEVSPISTESKVTTDKPCFSPTNKFGKRIFLNFYIHNLSSNLKTVTVDLGLDPSEYLSKFAEYLGESKSENMPIKLLDVLFSTSECAKGPKFILTQKQYEELGCPPVNAKINVLLSYYGEHVEHSR